MNRLFKKIYRLIVGENIFSNNTSLSLLTKSIITRICSIAISLRFSTLSFSSNISVCNLEFSFFRVDICPWRLVFCCFSFSFSAVNRCIFSDSVSPGNGSGTVSVSGNWIGAGSGEGSGIPGGLGSC